MRVFKFTIFFTLLATLSFGQAGPEMKLEEKKFDFGKHPYRQLAEHGFVFTNSGDVPLVIEKSTTSCHCTTVLYPKQPIMPGDTGTIRVRYDATKEGRFYRKVILYTNAGKEVLVIKGEILPKQE